MIPLPAEILGGIAGVSAIMAGIETYRYRRPTSGSGLAQGGQSADSGKTLPEPRGPVVEKRRVTMTNPGLGHRAIDYVPVDILDAYVADARTRWESVVVGDSHDPGPGGDYGPTFIHPNWKSPNA